MDSLNTIRVTLVKLLSFGFVSKAVPLYLKNCLFVGNKSVIFKVYDLSLYPPADN